MTFVFSLLGQPLLLGYVVCKTGVAEKAATPQQHTRQMNLEQ